MLGKKTRFMLILAAACGLPYLWFDGHLATVAKEKWRAFFSGDSDLAATRLLIGDGLTRPREMAHHAGGDAAREDSLPSVLRFDVSPQWVTQRWDRVSTVHTLTHLNGLRVPLVTGTETDDLAGSLTYYFDTQKRVQRIDFHGHTGDERRVVAVCADQFGLRAEPTLGAGMYVARWNARPTSVLRISFAPVIRADDPHRRLEVALQINRPSAAYGLSPEFEAMLTQM
jgi:hypothetical protein